MKPRKKKVTLREMCNSRKVICKEYWPLVYLDHSTCPQCGVTLWTVPDEYQGALVHAQLCFGCRTTFYDSREIAEIEKKEQIIPVGSKTENPPLTVP